MQCELVHYITKRINEPMAKVMVIFILALSMLCMPGGALADFHCPNHSWAMCRPTGERGGDNTGQQYAKYHCSCGEDFWVKD